MAIQLGRKAAANDAVGLLLECHDRIRAFVALAKRLAADAGGVARAVADAAGQVRRYFTEALPLHALDEELSIVPRLRGRDAQVDAELETMIGEHRAHERPLAGVLAACEEVARAPERLDAVRADLASAAAELERHFDEHLAREERVIFPAMARLLDPSLDQAIVREIRARRGVGPPNAP
jgi:iron-sulfur cluster repair protein YtfE (RIC family)